MKLSQPLAAKSEDAIGVQCEGGVAVESGTTESVGEKCDGLGSIESERARAVDDHAE